MGPIDFVDASIDTMDIGAINLNLMVALHALLSERSVTRAAKRCGLTQSSMSYSLAKLRALFDDPLLLRRAGTLVPTPLATSLLPRLSGALTDLQLVLNEKQGFVPARSRRLFRIAASDMFQLVALPKLLAQIAATAPGVQLILRPALAPSFEALASGALDLMIDGGVASAPAPIAERELFRQRYVCIVRRRHPRVGKRLSLASFCALSHVLVSHDEAPGLVDRALELAGRSRHTALRIPDYAALGHVIAGSDLIATVPELVAQVLSRTLPLRALHCPLKLRDFGVSLYWHERYTTDPGLRWLREQLADVVLRSAP